MKLKAWERLTTREHEVLALLKNGMTNRQIATTLFIEESTVETHLDHIYRKLNVPNRTAAVIKAIQYGIGI